MCGTEMAFGSICLRTSYLMRGTENAYGALLHCEIKCKKPHPWDIEHRATQPDPRSEASVLDCATVLHTCYAMYGTGLDFRAIYLLWKGQHLLAEAIVLHLRCGTETWSVGMWVPGSWTCAIDFKECHNTFAYKFACPVSPYAHATRCPVLTLRMALYVPTRMLRDARYCHNASRAWYLVQLLPLCAYAFAMRCPVRGCYLPTRCAALSGTGIVYPATYCNAMSKVPTEAIVLRNPYAISGTNLLYPTAHLRCIVRYRPTVLLRQVWYCPMLSCYALATPSPGTDHGYGATRRGLDSHRPYSNAVPRPRCPIRLLHATRCPVLRYAGDMVHVRYPDSVWRGYPPTACYAMSGTAMAYGAAICVP
eukprot:953832-Rhodomonas_salina.1